MKKTKKQKVIINFSRQGSPLQKENLNLTGQKFLSLLKSRRHSNKKLILNKENIMRDISGNMKNSKSALSINTKKSPKIT